MAERSSTRLGSDSRRLIVEAALELFRDNGVDATSLQMIADKLGVTKAAIYYHFKTKDEIVLGATGPMLDEANAFLDWAERITDPAARIRATVEGVVDFSVRYRALLAPGPNGSAVDQSNPDAPELFSGYFRRLVELLGGPDDSPERTMAAQVFLAGAGTVATRDFSSGVPDERLRAALVDAGVRMLLPL